MNKIDTLIVGAGTAGLISALYLREKYPFLNITILRSKEIGIIGVGEGSTEHWDELMRFLGLSPFDIITKTDATIKIGILFKDWNKGEQYVHSVGNTIFSNCNRLETYNHLLLKNSGSLFPLAPEFEKIYYKNNVALNANLKPSNQYHFDTFKLNEFFVDLCKSRSIDIIDSMVEGVVLNESGDVESLKLQNGENLSASLYIDCSGLKRVLSKEVGCKWVSFADRLPLNHAIAFPTEFDDPDVIPPYTSATALSTGWAWQIPTQTRFGNGYVFCDSYTNSDKALGEISEHLGKNIEKAARDIKFEAGRLDKFWKNNVVSIGLAGSFAEPLEAQSIGFTIIQAKMLLDCLDVWQVDRTISEKYNDIMTKSFENVINYLQLHYITSRSDTQFWQEKPFKISEYNQRILELAGEGLVDPIMFSDNVLMFTTANWFQILAGLNLINKDFLSGALERNRARYNSYFERETFNHVSEIKNSFRITSHRDFLNMIKKNYEYANEG